MRISDWSSDVCSSDLGWIGHVIDTLAVFATLFGLATSLGFGTEQALAGLNYLFGTPTGNGARVLLIALITAAATISVVRGLDGGVKVLSEINIALAALLLAFIFLVGPTARSEEHRSELQSLMRISYAVFCLTNK